MPGLRLTDELIKRLTTDKPQEDFFHLRTPNAGIRVTKDCRKVFFILYRSPTIRDGNGKPKLRRLTLGEHTSGKPWQPVYLTVGDFIKAYDQVRGAVSRGTDPKEVPGWTIQLPANGNGGNGNAGNGIGYNGNDGSGQAGNAIMLSPRRRRAPMSTNAPALLATVPQWLEKVFPELRVGTFGAMLVEWFDAAKTGRGCKQLAPRTLSNYVSSSRTHLQTLAKLAPSDITLEMVEDLFRAIATKPAKNDKTTNKGQMVRFVKKIISGGFEHARAHMREYRILANPTRGIRIAIPKGKRSRFLNEEELATLEFGLGAIDPVAADVYRLILASGCRPGEASAIDASDIRTMGGERVWKLSDNKSKRDFQVPVEGLIAEVIDRRLAATGGNGPLFWPGVDAASEYPPQLRKANEAIRKVTGLDFRPHDLRRTFRTHIAALGVPNEVAEMLLNHAKDDLVGTYSLYDYWSQRKDALARWHAHLATIVG